MADKRITNLPVLSNPTLSDEMHINDILSNFDKKILLSVLRNLLSVPYIQVSISNYDNDLAPAVKQGSSFDSKETPVDVASDATPTGYSGIAVSTTFYLYWDESAGSFIYSSTAPTWSDLYQGWYNVDDRALFSMYKDSGGTLYQLKTVLRNPSVMENMTIGNLITNGGIDAGNNGTYLKTKVIEIGDWNMDSTSAKAVTHGLTKSSIRSVNVIIRSDAGSMFSLSYANSTIDTVQQGGIQEIGTTQVNLVRFNGGWFDATAFDSTSYNRGWITIMYEA